MLSQSNHCISVSIGEDVLKICQVKGKGTGAKVTNILAKDIKSYSDSDLPKVIQDALKAFNTKGADIIGVISPSMTTTKNIEIPSINEEEIKSIVSLQAGRHTPFSREEIQVGYINIGVYKSNYTKVLLVIANKNIIKNQIGIFEKAGIKLKRIFFSPEGVAALYNSALNLKAERNPVAVIDVGRDSTDFVIVFRGIALTVRNIPVGRDQLAGEGEKAREKLVEELVKTIESYQGEDIEPVPSRYILTSDDPENIALQSLLSAKAGWNVEIKNYTEIAKMGSGLLKKMAAAVPNVSLLGIIGAASVAKDAKVDLMPEEILLQRSLEEQGKEVFKTAMLVFVTLVLVASALGFKLFFRQSFLNRLRKDYSKNRNEVARLEDMSRRTMLIRDYIEGRMVSLDLINELYKKIPRDVYLTSIVMDEEGNVNIQGISEVASVVFNLGTTLKESDMFTSVDIKSTTAKKDRGKDVSAFEITLKIKSLADVKQ